MAELFCVLVVTTCVDNMAPHHVLSAEIYVKDRHVFFRVAIYIVSILYFMEKKMQLLQLCLRSKLVVAAEQHQGSFTDYNQGCS